MRRKGPVTQDPSASREENDYVWDGEPFWLTIGDAVIHVKLSDLSARLSVDTYRHGGESEEPLDTALLALPGSPETGEEC